MEIWRERNVATVVYFPLIDRGTLDFENTPPTFVAADCQFSVDKGAFANTGSTPVHEGNGIYSLDLLAAEINGQNTSITIIDSATKLWEDQAIIISTYGDSSAEHAVNLNDSVRAGLTALPNFAADAAGGLPVSDLGGLDLDAKLANTNEITVARMGALTDWIDAGRLDLILDIIAADVVNIDGEAMRGTNSALLAASAPTNFGDLAIVVTTGLVSVGTMAANVINAASIAAAAMNGKGDWNIGKTGYSLTQVFPTNFADLAITVTTGRIDLALWLGVAPNALVSNRVDASVGAMAANVLTAAAINTAAFSEPKFATAFLTAAKFAAGAIDAAALNADAVDKIRDGLLPTQNATFDDIPFLFVDSTDDVTPVTGATGIVITRSLDGAAFGAVSGTTVTEIGFGMYHIDASAADMNAGKIVFRITASGGTPNAPHDAQVSIITGGGV